LSCAAPACAGVEHLQAYWTLTRIGSERPALIYA
jgi:hypothetical protein